LRLKDSGCFLGDPSAFGDARDRLEDGRASVVGSALILRAYEEIVSSLDVESVLLRKEG
jgi:hypothetical protein